MQRGKAQPQRASLTLNKMPILSKCINSIWGNTNKILVEMNTLTLNVVCETKTQKAKSFKKLEVGEFRNSKK